MREPFPSKSLRNAEGAGKALRRLLDFASAVHRQDPDAELIGDVLFHPPFSAAPFVEAPPVKSAAVFSELVGFWVTWHVTGGFERLELAGWHRATIYRKVARFREFFGAHPDEYEFDWLKIDAEKVWEETLRDAPIVTFVGVVEDEA
jgi:hypothetical protein